MTTLHQPPNINYARLCKNCAWLAAPAGKTPDTHPTYWKCDASRILSPLDGESPLIPHANNLYCEVRRMSPLDECGREGKLWIPAARP